MSVEERFDLGEGWEEPTIVYPAPRRVSFNVPPGLRRELEQAQTCLEAKAYTACVVMVRRTLEGTCAENAIEKRNLAEALRELHSRGIIDGTLVEWADALRGLGNTAAHYTGGAVSRQDADDALPFAEALLDHIYVLRKRFDEFKQRLGK